MNIIRLHSENKTIYKILYHNQFISLGDNQNIFEGNKPYVSSVRNSLIKIYSAYTVKYYCYAYGNGRYSKMQLECGFNYLTETIKHIQISLQLFS
jgi:hypothetical protein